VFCQCDSETQSDVQEKTEYKWENKNGTKLVRGLSLKIQDGHGSVGTTVALKVE